MPDSNARRDKALEGIHNELKETNKLLAKIERNTRRVTITNTDYLEWGNGVRNDGSQQRSGSSDPGSTNGERGPYGTGATHPYE